MVIHERIGNIFRDSLEMWSDFAFILVHASDTLFTWHCLFSVVPKCLLVYLGIVYLLPHSDKWHYCKRTHISLYFQGKSQGTNIFLLIQVNIEKLKGLTHTKDNMGGLKTKYLESFIR